MRYKPRLMKRLLSFVLGTVMVTTGYAQTDTAATYAKEITGPGLQKHLIVIAGEEMEGRETGTEGQRKAAAYIISQFREMGLDSASALKGYEQFYPLLQDTQLLASLSIAGKEAGYGQDYIIPRTNSNGKVQASKIIFAGYGIDDKNYSDYKGLNVKGKIVVVMLGEPKKDGDYIVSTSKKPSEWSYPGIAKKIALAAEKGAVGVLLINPAQETFSKRMTEDSRRSNVYYPKQSKERQIPHAILGHSFAKSTFPGKMDSIISKAAVSRTFTAADAWEKTLSTNVAYNKKVDTIVASNVIGTIPGTDKANEYVFVTAHYDHLGKRDGKIYYGADDDGSGTVAVMEMARAFRNAANAGIKPRRTLVFMTVSGEEKGLWGSEYYSDNPIFPLENTSVDLNIDMIGRTDTERKTGDTLNYIYVVGHDKISSELPVINEAMNNKYTRLNFDYKFDDPNDPNRIYYRSDHYNFARKGVPVLFFYDGMLQSDYHKPTDTVDKINWDLFEKRTRMIFHTAWEIANRDEMLKRDKPLPTGTR